MALAPPGRQETVNPILSYDLGVAWKGGQVMEPSIIVDPKDSSRLLMYFCGQQHGGTASGVGGISRMTADADDPKVWTEEPTGPLISPGASGAWDDVNIRCDCVVYDPVADQFKLYYTGNGGGPDRIGLATSPGNDGLTFTKHASNPIFTEAQVTGITASQVCESAVWRADATHWYMFYAHSGSDGQLPNIRLATSPDGIVWTDTGTVSWAKGANGTYDDTFKEWHQITKVGSDFVLIAECYDGDRWTVGAASSPTLTGTFTKLADPIFVGSGESGTFDKTHVATPAIYNLDGQWFLFYCGTPQLQPYSDGYWSLGMARF